VGGFGAGGAVWVGGGVGGKERQGSRVLGLLFLYRWRAQIWTIGSKIHSC
jgi:hypothetical protein